jgi:hypothetical protein
LDAVLAAFLSAGLTVLGTGLLQARNRRRKEEGEDDRRLFQALSEFGFALDALILELQQLPLTKQRTVVYWEWIERHAPAFDSLVGRLARVLFGRELFAAIERLQKATNTLMLIAPPSALEALKPIFSQLEGYVGRDGAWLGKLQKDRTDFAEVSQSLVSGSTFNGQHVDRQLNDPNRRSN